MTHLVRSRRAATRLPPRSRRPQVRRPRRQRWFARAPELIRPEPSSPCYSSLLWTPNLLYGWRAVPPTPCFREGVAQSDVSGHASPSMPLPSNPASQVPTRAPIAAAIARNDRLAARPREISSRSSKLSRQRGPAPRVRADPTTALQVSTHATRRQASSASYGVQR